jgi:hypothetical protein
MFFGRYTMLAAAAAAVFTASPALAATANPVGGQMGGMWTQEAPTRYFNTEMGAVLAPRVQYLSVGTTTMFAGAPTTINYRYGLGGGGEAAFGVGANLAAGGATTFGASVGGGYKQQLTRAGNMAMAFNVGAGISGIGAGAAIPIGIEAGLPITLDVGSSLLSIQPGIWATNVTNFSATAAVGAGVGLQAPLANFWSFLGEVRPQLALAGNAFTMPITLGARLSPTALSHVDFTIGTVNVTPGFGLTVGTIGVAGHVGFR